MGSFDSANICELVSLYFLNVLDKRYEKKRVGLYRDNGSACFENVSETQAE